MNIYLIGSPWHAVIAVAHSRLLGISDDSYLIEYFSDATVRSIQTVLEGACGQPRLLGSINWRDVSLEELHRKHGAWGMIPALRRGVRQTTQRARAFAPAAVHFFNVNSPVLRAFARGLNTSVPLVKLEDGVVDYLPFKYTGRRSPLIEGAKAALSGMLGVRDIFVRNYRPFVSRVRQQYSVFPDVVEVVGKAEVRDASEMADTVRSILACACDRYRVGGIEEGAALVIGQTLYEDRSMALEAECEVYARVALQLAAQCGQVYLKPHPRTSREKRERLRELFSGLPAVHLLEVDLPVEALMVGRGFSVTVGLWSNPVIYGRRLLGINAYSLMHELQRQGAMTPLLLRIHRTLTDKFPRDYLDFFDR